MNNKFLTSSTIRYNLAGIYSVNIYIAIAIYLSFSLTLLTIIKLYYQYEGIIADVGVWGVFYTLYGVLYAIISGLILVEELRRYAEIESTIVQEVVEIKNLSNRIKSTFNSEKSQIFIGEILNYIQSILSKEWSILNEGVEEPTIKKNIYIKNIIEMLNLTDISENKYDKIEESIYNISALNYHRNSLAENTIPLILRIVLAVMSISLVMGFCMLAVNSIIVHIFIVTTLTLTIIFISAIIDDFSSPFSGVFSISPKPFIDLKENL
jgi:hypothetical protein